MSLGTKCVFTVFALSRTIECFSPTGPWWWEVGVPPSPGRPRVAEADQGQVVEFTDALKTPGYLSSV